MDILALPAKTPIPNETTIINIAKIATKEREYFEFIKTLSQTIHLWSNTPRYILIAKIMISRYVHKKLHWIDLESPTKEEVREMMDEYGFHP
ncbi:MAG: hypothetical protein KAR20_13350, partial [Candidatus Heimdallarchaeota archaeon]|nr:hypothetical protein [Candidatus Heimdallarchaeota archaeon]